MEMPTIVFQVTALRVLRRKREGSRRSLGVQRRWRCPVLSMGANRVLEAL